ncbi:PP2C-like domain-containing protein [Penaeus vannamei]|uniref:PP2C-like domain-containing protein n=1 Tax=Penaeus vannamei TaxID=6689 RepID=A0A3R7MBH1_PENVA|nr:PP2C-like domain-containing protein [Penaeus vannamei]
MGPEAHRPGRRFSREMRGVQPDIVYGRTCEELPSRKLRRPRPKVLAAFTGPGGGLASVNRGGHPPLQRDEADLDYIDADDAMSDAQPNAYVTSQKPPPLPDPDLKRSETEEIAGLLNWNRPHQRAYGLSTTLYERHPVTNERAGNPIADAFGVVAREDSAILALADGVNWGEKASIAARCAIHGCLHHLNTALYSAVATPPETTTQDIFVALLRSFHAAHSLILQEDGMLTTLTAAVVAPLADTDQFVVCVCNVGDSLAYVYSQKYGVREITQGSHDIYSMRDMRDALGALGPVDGQNPELNNLTCSLTYCDPGDIVFLTSDGISDNFDPVVGKFAIPKKEKESKTRESQSTERPSTAKEGRDVQNGSQEPQNTGNKSQNPAREPQSSRRNGERVSLQGRQMPSNQQRSRSRRTQQGSKGPNVGPGRGGKQPVTNVKSVGAGLPEDEVVTDPFLPLVEAHQRHELTLLRMEDLLRCGLTSKGPVMTAQGLCLEMVHFATKLTVAKRRILEDPDLYPSASKDLSRSDQRNRRRKVCEKLALVPGKLDHATVVAYNVGHYRDDDILESIEDPVRKSLIKSGIAAPLASPDSARSLVSQMEESRPTDLPVSSRALHLMVVWQGGSRRRGRPPNTEPSRLLLTSCDSVPLCLAEGGNSTWRNQVRQVTQVRSCQIRAAMEQEVLIRVTNSSPYKASLKIHAFKTTKWRRRTPEELEALSLSSLRVLKKEIENIAQAGGCAAWELSGPGNISRQAGIPLVALQSPGPPPPGPQASGELVGLLQERQGLQEEVDIRSITIEQLLKFAERRQVQLGEPLAIQMSVVRNHQEANAESGLG